MRCCCVLFCHNSQHFICDFLAPAIEKFAEEERVIASADGHAVVPRRPRLATRGDMVLQTECRQVGDGWLGRRFRRRSSTVFSPAGPSVVRFRPAGPLDWTM